MGFVSTLEHRVTDFGLATHWGARYGCSRSLRIMTRRINRLGRTGIRILVFALVLCGAAVRLTQADPSDDFSFTLVHSAAWDAYDLEPEAKVTEVFRDRLDLFPRSQAPKLARHLVALCDAYRFDPAFILSLISVESRFHIRARSSVGAVGLMQIMPATARRVVEKMGLELGIPHQSRKLRVNELADPFVNLTIGVAYLAWLRDHYHGLPPYYLVAAYNVGPTRMDELLSKGPHSFRPVQTKKYFEAVRRGIPEFRFYTPRASQAPAHRL